jgi:hypothetical protein
MLARRQSKKIVSLKPEESSHLQQNREKIKKRIYLKKAIDHMLHVPDNLCDERNIINSPQKSHFWRFRDEHELVV